MATKILGLFLLLLALGLPMATDMVSPRVVRAACGSSLCIQIKDDENAGSDTTIDIVLDSNQTAGSLNAVDLWFCDNASCNGGTVNAYTIAVTDTLTHTYSEAVRRDYDHAQAAGAADDVLATYYVCNTSSGANTITVTVTPGGGGTEAYYLWASVTEYSGIAASSCLDQVGDDAGTGTTVTANTDGATTQANELVHGVAVGANAVTGTSTVLSSHSNGTIQDQYKTVSGTGTQSLSWTQTSGTWDAVIATFKETVAGGGGGATRSNLTLMGVQ